MPSVRPTVVAVTMGDPAGVGPELLAKLAAGGGVEPEAILVAIADPQVLALGASAAGVELGLEPINVDEIGDLTRRPRVLPVVEATRVDMESFRFGELRAENGRAAYDCLVQAIDLAMQGSVDAIVTNPINKEAINLAGFSFAGHTEILAERTGTEDYAMMLAHGPMRVAHVSTHVSLREACSRVTADRVYRVIRLLAEALEDLGIADPRIAVAGLNPHAGEHGLFGSEELDEIIPAVERAGSEGIRAEGPFPPDTLFPRLVSGTYDGAVVMYHDQGHIPLKLTGFTSTGDGGFSQVEGVNITLGLPIVRTSVDHGTAFDIAGTGRAHQASLAAAVEYACRLVKGRKLG